MNGDWEPVERTWKLNNWWLEDRLLKEKIQQEIELFFQWNKGYADLIVVWEFKATLRGVIFSEVSYKNRLWKEEREVSWGNSDSKEYMVARDSVLSLLKDQLKLMDTGKIEMNFTLFKAKKCMSLVTITGETTG